ncbi:MAG: DUF748 domain-containing protein [Nitrospiraceae bacterium]|nr:MAG: DUF748 domain-containing protein [Nitrospiraceae bacterium]
MTVYLSRWWGRVLGGIAAMILIVVVLSYFISSDTLRRYMESQMNRQLNGYTVHIERAYFHPVGFSIDLDNLVLTQDSVPAPPVAYFGRLHASVHWQALLNGRLVADFLIDRPKVNVNLKNILKEAESKVPFNERGWRQSLEAITPLKINLFRVRGGELTYTDEGSYRPLHMSMVNLEASNIRNIRSPERVYPSSIHLEGTIFDSGKLMLDGQVNFLQEPHIGLKADLDLNNMDLSYFDPITKRGNFSVQSGTLSAKGNFEYAPEITQVNFKNINITGVKVDYLHLPQTVKAEQNRVSKTAKTAKKLSNEPTSKIKVDRLRISESNFAYVNRTTDPNYRLFFDKTELTLTNLTSQLKEGVATLELKGKFMGTGDTVVKGTFRPYSKDPDFDLNIAIKDTHMTDMSDLFRSYGNFDIKEGLFSFYSEIEIKGGRINGYVKPLFKNMKVYDSRKQSEKGLFHKL